MGHVVSEVGGVAPLVIAVVALHHVIVLDLLDHQHLVNAPLAVKARSGGGDLREAWRTVFCSLALVPDTEILGGDMIFVVMLVLIVGVEGEGVDQRLSIPILRGVSLKAG